MSELQTAQCLVQRWGVVGQADDAIQMRSEALPKWACAAGGSRRFFCCQIACFIQDDGLVGRVLRADAWLMASAGQGTDRAAGFIKPRQGVSAVQAQWLVSARGVAQQAGPWQQLPENRAAQWPQALPGGKVREGPVRFFHVEAFPVGMLNDE